MLQALVDSGIRPDLVVGTSVGAFNGAAIAADPSPTQARELVSVWLELSDSEVFQASLWTRATNVLRHRTHLHSNEPLRRLLNDFLAVDTFEALQVPFQCVAACIEDAAEHWFENGSLIEAILASSAVPGLLPPVEIGGKHYVDGGVVNSIPVSRALELGATDVYVLHVGHIDSPLEAPTRPWDVAMVAFEIARRHRLTRDLTDVPKGVSIHVLPTGDSSGEKFNDPAKLRYTDFSVVRKRIDSAYRATAEYLEGGP